jgi:hypothetical protein
MVASYIPGRSALYVFGSLPELNDRHVYEVWLFRGPRFLRAGAFRPQRGIVLLRLPFDGGGFDQLLITEEPNEASVRPSGRHVVRGTLG